MEPFTTPGSSTGQAPGELPSRRARRQSEREAPRRRGLAALGLPTAAVTFLRAGVAGAAVLSVGAVTLAQSDVTSDVLGAPAGIASTSLASLDHVRTSGAEQRGESFRTALEAPEVQSGGQFTVEVDGESIEIDTEVETLAEALLEAGIVVAQHDVVTASMRGSVPQGAVVQIHRSASDLEFEEETISCDAVEEEDPDLPRGETRVETEGRDGTITTTYRVRETGDERSREQLSAVTQDCVPEVTRVGTQAPAPVVAQSSPETSSSLEAPAGSSSAPATAGEDAGADAGEAPASQPSAPAATVPSNLSGNRALGAQLAANRGWTGEQWTCLERLWTRESGWNHQAANPISSARGIPQAMMSVHFPDWPHGPNAQNYLNNPGVQIEWGLNYIAGRYGSPCGAWGVFQRQGHY